MDGKVIGTHRGYPFYTIGQRKGIGVALHEPIYVSGIDHKNNSITVGSDSSLYHSGLLARKLNLMKYHTLSSGRRLLTKIRYKDAGDWAAVTQIDGKGGGEGTVRVEFEQPKRAMTPGQSVVFYEGDDLVGGAVIDSILV